MLAVGVGIALALPVCTGARPSAHGTPTETGANIAVVPLPSVVGSNVVAASANVVAAAPNPPASPAIEPIAPIAPLRGEPVIELEVPGHARAIVSRPLGAVSPRPILVATHGRNDRAEWHCALWREAVADRGFVLCPQGTPTSMTNPRGARLYTYEGEDALLAEIDAAIAALRAAYPQHVDPGPVVFAGFSLGAYYGARAMLRDPRRAPRLALIEGGHDPWSDEGAKAFAAGGGERVLFVCSQGPCVIAASPAKRTLERAGVAAQLFARDDDSHTYSAGVRTSISFGFRWLIEGDKRW